MDLLPQFELSLYNAFWFSAVYLLTNIIFLRAYPSHYKKRVLAMPEFEGKFAQTIGTINFMLFQGLLLLVIFNLNFISLFGLEKIFL